MKVRLIDLGTVPYWRSQTIFHGIAHALGPASPDTITLLSPAQPYVCIGYHQDLDKEIDLDYCQAQGLPLMRREVGGGAVYLDGDQVFYHWIFQPGHLPRAVEEVFRIYCQTLVDTYRALGIAARHRPVNDILVRGRKIGGTGAATIGAATVMAGSLMFDFDFEVMARALKAPSEQFRAQVLRSLQEYMTTMRRELGQAPARQLVKDVLIQQCERVLGATVEPGDLTEEEERAVAELDDRFLSPAWLQQPGGLRQEGVKIREGVRVVETTHPFGGGLLTATVRLAEGRIDDIRLSGSFPFPPPAFLASLEQSLRGVEWEEGALRRRVSDCCARLGAESSGAGLEDWAVSLLRVGQSTLQERG